MSSDIFFNNTILQTALAHAKSNQVARSLSGNQIGWILATIAVVFFWGRYKQKQHQLILNPQPPTVQRVVEIMHDAPASPVNLPPVQQPTIPPPIIAAATPDPTPVYREVEAYSFGSF